MQNIYLVFRRDYLGYVSAWGFWLGILSMPLLIILGGVAGAFAASSTPTRYYAVIESTPEYGPAIEASFQERIDRAREVVVDQVERFTGSDDNTAEIVERAEESIPLPKFVRVEAPGRTIDDLRPWLLGERMIDGPLGEKPLFAAIIVPPDGGPIEYWSEDVNVDDLRFEAQSAARSVTRTRFLEAEDIDPEILSRAADGTPDVLAKRVRETVEQAESGDEITVADRAPFILSLIFSYALWFIIFSAGQYLLMGTIEERSNKIFDTLLTAVKLPQLLSGKLGAVLAVTFTMIGAWFITGTALTLFGATYLSPDMQSDLFGFIGAGLQPSLIVPTLLSLVLGYLMYGVIFIALGSLCDTIQEAQTLLSPMIMFMMIPMFMLILAAQDPESPIVAAMSWIPLFTPYLLILRIPTEPPLWEVLAQLALTAGTAALVMWLATKVYRAGAVHGAGVGEAVNWLRGLVPGLGKKTADIAE